jgi:hypothetical protein
MEMIDKVKIALRLKTAAFDTEIEGLIAACKADLRLVGIIMPDEAPPAEGVEPTAGDPLIERAVLLYAKAHFGYLEDSERYKKDYDLLKCRLSLAGGYHALE